MNRYQVGDKVRVKSSLEADGKDGKFNRLQHGDFPVNAEMASRAGENVTITSVASYGYRIKEDPFVWTESMFEGVITREEPPCDEQLLVVEWDYYAVVRKGSVFVEETLIPEEKSTNSARERFAGLYLLRLIKKHKNTGYWVSVERRGNAIKVD